jgi:hypothetical protein
LDQSTNPPAKRSSLNTKQECLKVVDTFRFTGMLDLSGRPPGAPNAYEGLNEGQYSAVLEARSLRMFPWASQEEERQK